MGWTFLYNAPEKRHVIEECLRNGGRVECVKKAVHGNELWTIWHDKETDKKHIILFLLAKQDGNWGYKDISESMGPYYHKCPLSFLKEVPETNPDWRARVRAYHAETTKSRDLLKKVVVGSVVKLKDSKPDTFKVSSTKPLLGIDLASGLTYKLIKKRIVEVT